MKQIIAIGFALVLGLAAHGSARAAPVVYALYAVTDGKLGSQTFSQAQVTVTFKGDTTHVTTEQGQDAVVYRNDHGDATVTLTQGASKAVAHIADGQIYVRYDPKNGAVGFASFAVGPTYPIYLDSGGFSDCIYGHQCLYPFNQIVSALADVAGYGPDQAFYSMNLEALSTSLTNSTLLTGYVDSACMPPAPSVACSSPIHTDLGDLYLQYSYGKGIFTVEVGEQEED